MIVYCRSILEYVVAYTIEPKTTAECHRFTLFFVCRNSEVAHCNLNSSSTPTDGVWRTRNQAKLLAWFVQPLQQNPTEKSTTSWRSPKSDEEFETPQTQFYPKPKSNSRDSNPKTPDFSTGKSFSGAFSSSGFGSADFLGDALWGFRGVSGFGGCCCAYSS